MAHSPDPFIASLTRELDRLHQDKATGEMIFRWRDNLITLYLLAGRLQYIVDRRYRMRRWKRAIFQHCRDWTVPTQILNTQPWEYDFLYQGIKKSALTLEQAKAVIGSVVRECLTELALGENVEYHWEARDRAKSTFSYFLSLSLPEVHPILTESTEIRYEWDREHLERFSLSSALTLTEKGKAIPNPNLQKYLNGQFTLWDVALQLKQPVIKVARSLLPWHEKGLLELKTLADLPCPVEDIEEVAPASNSTETPRVEKAIAPDAGSQNPPGKARFLIACIDDSPIVIHNLKTILTPAGFEVLSIQEPMAGFGQLIERKPDLILLDLNMPNANGYSICKFLRETPVFGHTPIIILTAQDSSIDRTRAKLAGANDFISKPAEAGTLIRLIETYLPQTAGALGRN